jgi:hypothetical protein
MPLTDAYSFGPSGTVATIGAPPSDQAPGRPPPASDRLAISLGVLLVGAIAALMLLVALRFLRRAADPLTHGFDQRKPSRGFERGRGRDPWQEAARRLVVPPTDRTNQKDSDDDQDEEPPMSGPGDRPPSTPPSRPGSPG